MEDGREGKHIVFVVMNVCVCGRGQFARCTSMDFVLKKKKREGASNISESIGVQLPCVHFNSFPEEVIWNVNSPCTRKKKRSNLRSIRRTSDRGQDSHRSVTLGRRPNSAHTRDRQLSTIREEETPFLARSPAAQHTLESGSRGSIVRNAQTDTEARKGMTSTAC